MFEDTSPADETFPDLAAAIAALDEPLRGGSAVRAGAEMKALLELRRRLDSKFLSRLDSFHQQGMADAWGCPSTRSFLRAHGRLDGASAGSLVQAAQASRQMPRLGELAAAGHIGTEHVAAVARHTHDLPESVVSASDEIISEAARVCRPSELARLAARVKAFYQQEKASESADSAAQLRYLKVATTFEGLVSVEGMLTAEAGAKLQAALAPLTRPAGIDDDRTHGQRCADAFEELVDVALRSGELPDCGSDRPRLTVVVQRGGATRATEWEPRVLLGELIGSPAEMPPAAIERMHCDADVDVMALDGHGEVLDLHRTARLPSRGQRRALVVRDKQCVFPHCDRPPGWCQAHHLDHWADGGPTDLGNLALLCSYHHHLVHEGGWLLCRIPPGDPGRPPGHQGQAWRATSSEGLELREFRRPAA